MNRHLWCAAYLFDGPNDLLVALVRAGVNDEGAALQGQDRLQGVPHVRVVIPLPGGFRVLQDDNGLLGRLKVIPFPQGCGIGIIPGDDLIDVIVPHHVHPPGLFPQLQEAGGAFRVGGKMEVGELGHGVADQFIHISREVAPLQMRDGIPRWRAAMAAAMTSPRSP